MPRLCTFSCAGALMLLLAACAPPPSSANIALRKENQALQDHIGHLQTIHDADAATIEALQAGRPTVPSLPESRLDELFITHGVQLGRSTGGDALGNTDGVDHGLKIFVVPVDQDGDPLKAAGSFTIEAFDLNLPQNPLLGTWTFDTKKAGQQWYNMTVLYTYILPCPWQAMPHHDELTVKVTFVDELTGRKFSAQRVVHVRLAATGST